MKLRTAYFCKQCDEEVDIEKINFYKKCPYCGYNNKVFGKTLVYEWKVEDRGEQIQVGINGVNGVKWGDSCPVNTLDRLFEGLKKLVKPDLEKE